MNHIFIIEALGGGNLVALAAIFWRVSRAAGAMETIMRNFPPHRHLRGAILYPEGYEPPGAGVDR